MIRYYILSRARLNANPDAGQQTYSPGLQYFEGLNIFLGLSNISQVYIYIMTVPGILYRGGIK
jgi:hypothetical protein